MIQKKITRVSSSRLQYYVLHSSLDIDKVMMVISSFAQRMFIEVTEEAQEASLFGCTCSAQLQHPAVLCVAPLSLYGCDTMVKGSILRLVLCIRWPL